MNKQKYTAQELATKLGMEYIKVYKRFISKFAEKRWGVVVVKLRDGTNKRYLPKENLSIWLEDNQYLGRPTSI